MLPPSEGLLQLECLFWSPCPSLSAHLPVCFIFLLSRELFQDKTPHFGRGQDHATPTSPALWEPHPRLLPRTAGRQRGAHTPSSCCWCGFLMPVLVPRAPSPPQALTCTRRCPSGRDLHNQPHLSCCPLRSEISSSAPSARLLLSPCPWVRVSSLIQGRAQGAALGVS